MRRGGLVADYPRRNVCEMEKVIETRTHETHLTLMGLGPVARAAVVALAGCLDALVEEHSLGMRAAERATLSRARLREVRALYVEPDSRKERTNGPSTWVCAPMSCARRSQLPTGS